MTENRLSGLAMLLIHRGTDFIPTSKEIYYMKSNWRRIWNSLIEYRSVTSQKNKFGKLWDLVPFLSKASLEKGPCQKLLLNCNSQPKYKGRKFDTAPHKSL